MGVITTSMSGTHGFLGITGSAFLYQHGRRRRLSSSGSFQSGSGGVTSGSGGSTSYSGSGRYSTFSTTGSIVSGSRGSTSASAGVTVHSGAHGYFTFSVTGSVISGSRGSTSASAGITVHSGAHGYFTFSTSGSVISGSRGSTSGSAGETTYSGSSYFTLSHSGSMVSGSKGFYRHTHSGSFLSGSRGSTSASAGITVHSGAHGYFTFSTTGSVISGSRGSTSGSAGETTYSGSSYYTISHSGSMVSGSGGLTLISTGAIGIGTASPATALTVEGTVTLKEQSAADSDTAAYGQIWVKDGTPNTLYFTDDAGTDTQLGAGSGRSVAGDTDNGVITWVTSDNTFAAEANMTFDGSTLTVTGDAVVTDDLSLNSDSAVLNFGAGNDVTFTHDGGTGMDIVSAGTLDIGSTAGSMTIGSALADGQTLKLGKNGAVETIIAPHGTAGSELYSVINTAGTTDGSDAAGAILLSSVAGGIGLAWADGKDLWAEGGRAVITANEDAADCIKLHADAGSSQTITVVNDAGTSVTEGSAAVSLQAAAGGVELRSTANLVNAINITNDGGTTGTITIFNDQGTSVTEGAASIQLLTDAGGIGIKSTANLAEAILLTTDGGAAESIKIHADQSTVDGATGAGAIELQADAGGICIEAAADKDVFVRGGQIKLIGTHDTANTIYLRANTGTSETIKIHADQGTAATSIDVVSDAGGIKLSAGLDNAASVHLVGYGMTFDGGDNNDSFLFNNSPISLEQISAPSSTTDKLWNQSGILTFGGDGFKTGGVVKANGLGASLVIASQVFS